MSAPVLLSGAAERLRGRWPWVVAAALWAGCLVPGPWPLALAGAAAMAAVTVLPAPARLALVAIAAVALGSGLAGARYQLQDSTELALLARAGGAARLTATVVTEPRATQHGAWAIVRVTSVEGRRSRARALLRLRGATEDVAFGERLAFAATARPLGRDGFEGSVRRLSAGTSLSALGPLQRAPPAPAVRATNVVRERVRRAAAAALPPAPAGLLVGLVTGDTSLLPHAEAEDLQQAGLTHLVAVSGSNVALVVAGVTGLAAAAGLGARGRRRVALLALLAFAVLVRAEPSVLRACAMAALVLAAQALGRGSDARHTLAVAVVLLLLVDPLLAGQLGFALSVLATAGVLLLGPAVARRVPGPRPLAVLIGATVGAQVAVAPVVVAVQGAVPLASIPANLVAVPAAAVASAFGVTAALVAQASPWLAALPAALAWPALRVVLWAGAAFSHGPQVVPQTLLLPCALGLGVVGAGVLLRGWRRPDRGVVATATIVALAGAGAPWVAGPGEVTALTVTALDIGQGDAILVEVPDAAGRTVRMLVDGGPDEDVVLRSLRRRRIRAVDVAVLSHPHADHADGLLAVLSRLSVGTLLVGPDPPAELDEPAPAAAALLAVAQRRGVAVTAVAAGQSFTLGRASVQVLSPPADGSLGREPNDNSVVLRVSVPHGSVLLTGDAEELAQSRLLRDPAQLRATVVKVPHHGGATNRAGFLQAVGASAALVSAGRRNTFGHPRPEVLDSLAPATVLRTDVDGDVAVVVDAQGLTIRR